MGEAHWASGRSMGPLGAFGAPRSEVHFTVFLRPRAAVHRVPRRPSQKVSLPGESLHSAYRWSRA